MLLFAHSVVSDSLRPHGLQPARLLCPWNSPGKNTRVDAHLPSPGDLPDPGIEPRFGSQEEPLEKGIAAHSSIPAYRIPWTEEPGRLQSMGSQRVEHD